MTAVTRRRDLPRRWWRHRSGTESCNARTTKETHPLRKIILGLVATAAFAAPMAVAGSANAATTCQPVPTTTGLATFHATQPSGGGGNWDHTFSVNVASDGGFTGTNVITGL